MPQGTTPHAHAAHLDLVGLCRVEDRHLLELRQQHALEPGAQGVWGHIQRGRVPRWGQVRGAGKGGGIELRGTSFAQKQANWPGGSENGSTMVTSLPNICAPPPPDAPSPWRRHPRCRFLPAATRLPAAARHARSALPSHPAPPLLRPEPGWAAVGPVLSSPRRAAPVLLTAAADVILNGPFDGLVVKVVLRPPAGGLGLQPAVKIGRGGADGRIAAARGSGTGRTSGHDGRRARLAGQGTQGPGRGPQLPQDSLSTLSPSAAAQ